ncbi:MAG: hypothetical protein WC297_01730 [Candidatus Paceibacterota bacterium]|jgi:hypothetical protein
MKQDSGQVMLITVLALGGMLLGATAIGGLLMTYQIRQSSDIANSTKAIMAADAGIERALYCANITGTAQRCDPANAGTDLNFSNGAKVTVSITGDVTDPVNPSLSIKSVGNSSQIYRALGFFLQPTPPAQPTP